MFFPTIYKTNRWILKGRNMMISGTREGAGLWDIPAHRIFGAITCRIPYMIKSTSRGTTAPDKREPNLIYNR
jgi:hypothetical protein